jgi:hypothetical protein
MDPMYGEDGWCRACGTPLRPQSGSIFIQGSKFPTANVWMPNWQFDVVCVASDVADQIQRSFNVRFGEVYTPRQGATGVKQILAEPTTEPWFEPGDLKAAVRARHRDHDGDRTGSTCGTCHRWKWLPVSEDAAPILAQSVASESDVIASPESFGDGLNSFHMLLFRRPLAELLLAVARRNWDLVEVKLT